MSNKNRYLSTEIRSFKAFGDCRSILSALKEAGFTAYDATMDDYLQEILEVDDYLEKAKELRAYADGLGLPCNQSHAPFPSWKKDDESYNQRLFPLLCRSLEVSGILGAKICVVHPNNDATAEENAAFYRRLEPYARQAGVKIALENMWNVASWEPFLAAPAACSHHEDFMHHLELLPSDVFVACLDIGHAEMAGLDTNAVTMIVTLGDRLQALHLHDNDRVKDYHELPYTMNIDFTPILAALARSGYEGDITLESSSYAWELHGDECLSAMKRMAQTAALIRDRLDAQKM